MRALALAAALAAATIAGAVTPAAAAAPSSGGGAKTPFVGPFHTESAIGSTLPPKGDVNPYGIAVVRASAGRLSAGDVLVSNFNAKSNLQGTGTTIVEISPGGQRRVFADLAGAALPGGCPGGVGLTTALSILPGGYVVVGSLPTTDGTAATARAGCLIVLDRHGHAVETIAGHGINGPWDMTAVSGRGWAALFVTNVLNGTVVAAGNEVDRGTVVRVMLRLRGCEPPRVVSTRVIANGLAERADPNALVIGPTGVTLGEDGTLYVADTLANRIADVDHALTRTSPAAGGADVSAGGALNGPLGLAVAPGGDLLTVNSGDGNLIEVDPAGAQVATRQLEPAGAGSLFGLAVAPEGAGVYYVDDATNTLDLLH